MPIQRLSLVCASFVALLAATARAEWILTTADLKQTKNVSINEWTIKDGISYTDSGGALKTSGTRDIVSLHNDQPTNPTTADWKLTLRNGDVLIGTPESLAQGKLQFNVQDLGSIKVPLKLISILQATDNKSPSTDIPIDRDLLRFKNGDTLDGVFIGFANGKVQIQKDDTTTEVELKRMDRLSIGGAIPARAIPPLSVRMTLPNGSILTTDSVAWKVATISFKDYTGADVACPIGRLGSLEVLGGRVVWLTDLDAVRADESTFLGAKFPMQINTNVMGQPLKIGHVAFERGLGVHTNSTLEYKLDGTFKQLGFSVGMDDSAAPSGLADVKVLIDGKVAWEQKGLKPGQPAIQQTLDIADAHKLELIATSPGTLDVLGRVNWVNIGLIRP